MNEVEALSRAIKMAAMAHYGQYDKSGQPYILHPLAVMNKMETYVEKIVAVLHDIIEDTPLTLLELKHEGDFSDEVIEAVDAITKREGESSNDYYRRLMINPLAVIVKIGDIEHNMSPDRLLSIREKDLKRIQYYHSRWKQLKKVRQNFR